MKTLIAGCGAATLLTFSACSDDGGLKSLEICKRAGVKVGYGSVEKIEKASDNQKQVNARLEARLNDVLLKLDTLLGPDGSPRAGSIKLESGKPTAKLSPDEIRELASQVQGLLELRGATGGNGAGTQSIPVELETRLRAMEERMDTTSNALREVAGTAGRAEEIAKQANPKKDKNFLAIAAELKLSEPQANAVKHELLTSKKALLDLLSTPTASGRNFANEVVDAFIDVAAKREGAEMRAQKILADLATEKIPGDGRTYVQAAEALKTDANTRVGRHLDSDQRDKYMAGWGTDPTGVEFGEEDPFTPLYLERVKLAGG